MNRRIVTIAVGLATAGLLAAGCGGKDGGGDGGDKPAASSTTEKTAAAAPIITPAAAAAVLDSYEKVNNTANKTRDKALLGTVEGGALYQEDSAVYKQYPKLSAMAKKGYFEPFTYSRRQFFIPTTGSWFMATAHTGDTLQLLVFRQQSGGRWKMVVANDYKGTLPALAKGPDGAPVVVAPDATVGATKLSALGAAVSDLRASGGKKAGAALADSEVKRAAVKAYTTRNDHWGRYKKCLRTDYEAAGTKWDTPYTKFPDTYALKTADGGALVASTSYFVMLDFSTRPDLCTMTPGGDTSAYVTGVQTGVRSRYLSMNVVSVPAAGKPVQLGGDTFLIGASS
ncbi:hypothetical protein [Actinacidiphila paucisporea]|uniref:DUF8094 domain-containing protein n=1 Tax=Actinacidiphila paucisporea TaxID=310782 RepID=A0A1M6UKP7_9ACTN|nr:hypothetical protein [Actinacidiphila paucisporea]SHK69713.1 hypothetical protein SAMN05216499_101399 [Actinacidiphila paucisporea]